MSRRLNSYYHKIGRHCGYSPGIKRQAKLLLRELVRKPEGFKIDNEQINRMPAHCCLMDLGFAVHENGFFRADPEIIKNTH